MHDLAALRRDRNQHADPLAEALRPGARRDDHVADGQRLAIDRDAANGAMLDRQVRDLGFADAEPVRERDLAECCRQQATVDPGMMPAMDRTPHPGQRREPGAGLLGRKLGVAVRLRRRPAADSRAQLLERGHLVVAHRDRQRAAHRKADIARPLGGGVTVRALVLTNQDASAPRSQRNSGVRRRMAGSFDPQPA